MMLLHDRASMAHALTLDLDPSLRSLLVSRMASLGDLLDWTEILIVEAEDTEGDIIREIGLSPLVDPVDGHRFPHPDFKPCWDHLVAHAGYYEMSISFGSGFAYMLIIDANSASVNLQQMAQQFSPNNP